MFVLSGCGDFVSNDLGPRDIDEDRARSTLSELRIAVPEGSTFVAGVESPPGFVGSSSWYLRFEPTATPAAVAELNAANGWKHPPDRVRESVAHQRLPTEDRPTVRSSGQ